jgi:serine/threonine protein kinase
VGRLLRRTALYEVYAADARGHVLRLVAGGVREDERLRESARVLAELSHAAILAVRGSGTWGGRPYLRLEPLEGHDLATLRVMAEAAGVEVTDEVGLVLLVELSGALARAHAAGVRHGFVGPASVVVVARGVVKLTDFRLGAAPDLRDETDDGVALAALLTSLGSGARPALAPLLRVLERGAPLAELVERARQALEARGVRDGRGVLAQWLLEVLPRAPAAAPTAARESPPAVPELLARAHDDDVRGAAISKREGELRAALSEGLGGSLDEDLPVGTATALSALPEDEPSTSRQRASLIDVGQVLDGRYQLLEELAVGGMGRLYRAVQLVVNREVAIKTVRTDGEHAHDEALLARFATEAQLISQLRHPHTLRVYDFGQVADELYLVTELLHGETVEDRLLDGPIEPRQVVQWLIDVADALAEAHGKGIIHRDLKPRNLFLDRVGDQELIKVLDFGLAKVVGHQGHTAVGMVMGSPAYMSPEQASGLPLGPPSDLYSLGVTAYEMLTARPPFAAAQPQALMLQHRHDPPPPMRSLDPPVEAPPELEALVRLLLAKDPAARPATAAELRDRLRALDPSPSSSASGRERQGGDHRLGSVLANHRLVEVLGAGASSRVYGARHEILGREVAIKVLDEVGSTHASAEQRLRREAQILARIEHPGVVAVLDCGLTPEGAPYVVLERIRGRTLRQLLSQEGRLPLPRALGIGRQICAALVAAHAQGVVHRDLKPANVMVLDGPGERVKVVDFGIARLRDPEGERTRLTGQRALLGSPTYMAPEQIEAPSEVGPAADLYALGCTLFALLVGHPPFRGSITDVLAAKRSRDPPALPRLGGLGPLVARLLARDPGQRPASAQEVLEALDAVDLMAAQGLLPGSAEPELEQALEPRGLRVTRTADAASLPGVARLTRGASERGALASALAAGVVLPSEPPPALDAQDGRSRRAALAAERTQHPDATPPLALAAPARATPPPVVAAITPARFVALEPPAPEAAPSVVQTVPLSPPPARASSVRWALGLTAAALVVVGVVLATARARTAPATSVGVAEVAPRGQAPVRAVPAVRVGGDSAPRVVSVDAGAVGVAEAPEQPVRPSPAARPSDAAPSVRVPAATATPRVDGPRVRARLDAALAARGLVRADLEALPMLAAVLLAAERDGSRPEGEAAIARAERAIADTRLEPRVAKAKLDRVSRSLVARAADVSTAELRALEDRYLVLASRLSSATTPASLEALLVDTLRLERDLAAR